MHWTIFIKFLGLVDLWVHMTDLIWFLIIQGKLLQQPILGWISKIGLPYLH